MVIRNIVGDQHPYANKKIDSKRSTEQTAQATTKDSATSTDRVILSPEARLCDTALQTAKNAPDIRREKVERLRQQVKDQTYKPDIKKAATNLLRDDLELLV